MPKKSKFKSEYINLKNGFIPLQKKLLTSDKWKFLSHTAKLAYINILFEFLSQIKKDAKNIICPHVSLVCPMDKNTWKKATQELERTGFIHVTRRSGYGRGQYPNIYALSNLWHKP